MILKNINNYITILFDFCLYILNLVFFPKNVILYFIK